MTKSTLPSPTPKSLYLRAYRAISGLFGPLADYALGKRLKSGKEHPERVCERRGIATEPRPEGKLIWIHGASVGESLSILPLVDRLQEIYPQVNFLVTTGTVTSAQLMAQRLPEKATHQFVPLDHPDYVKAFLDHWQPSVCLFVESELWPNLIQGTAARGVPMALINGRISPKSYDNWKNHKGAIENLLSSFTVILGQDVQNTTRLAELSNRDVPMLGNLKMAADILPANSQSLEELVSAIGARPLWLAASTHEGEEALIIDAHQRAVQRYPDLLTVIAPRHPNRGEEIETLASNSHINASMRSKKQPIEAATAVYIADTLGELGLFYRLSDVAFIGGSLVQTGGHNPLEPARLKAAILHGPYTFNFEDTYREMRQAGGSALVRNERDLAASLVRLLTDDVTRETMATKAEQWASTSAQRVLVKIVDALAPVLSTLRDQS